MTTLYHTDVLLGRGGFCNRHSGNKTYREIVASHRSRYLEAKKEDKRKIAAEVVTCIHERGGRFLEKHKNNTAGDTWMEVEEDRAVTKAVQALREGLDVRKYNHKKKLEERGRPKPPQPKRQRRTKSAEEIKMEHGLKDLVAQQLETLKMLERSSSTSIVLDNVRAQNFPAPGVDLPSIVPLLSTIATESELGLGGLRRTVSDESTFTASPQEFV